MTRWYGCWAGNPLGVREDPALCVESIYPNERGPIPHQCSRKRGHGEAGLFCPQHAKRAGDHGFRVPDDETPEQTRARVRRDRDYERASRSQP